MRERRRIVNYEDVIGRIFDHDIWEISPILPGSAKVLRQFKRNKKALCPYHDEETPSCQWVTDRGFGCCHGCGTNFMIIDLFAYMRNISRFKAVVILAKFFKVKIKWRTVKEHEYEY